MIVQRRPDGQNRRAAVEFYKNYEMERKKRGEHLTSEQPPMRYSNDNQLIDSSQMQYLLKKDELEN